MNKNILSLFIFSIIFFFRCGTSDKKENSSNDSVKIETKNSGNSKELILKKIERLDSLAHLPNNFSPDKNLAQQLISSYSEYSNNFPQDTLASRYSFLAATVALNIYSDRQALVLIDNCLKSFPSHPKKLELLIMKALVYDDRLGDKPNAKLVYEQIIKDFPNSPAAEQAKDAIKLVGKTDLELIREMEKKNGVK
jgi:hypothetical protein